jgi:hypothetical protein
MLFYERNGIDMKAYLPKFREPSTSSAESANIDNTSASGATSAGNGPIGASASNKLHSAAVNGLGVHPDEQEEGKKCRLM